MDLSIRSRRVVTPDGISAATIFVVNGEIVEIGPVDAPSDAREQIDAGNLYVLPGLVDAHVHVNEPGRTEWEGFTTATQAAAAGGYTTIIDMPLNCLPETTTVASLTAKREAARNQCWVNYGFWGGVVSNNQSHIKALADAGVLGYKCFLIYPGIEGFTMVTRGELEAAMPMVASTGLPLLVHAELAGPVDSAMAELDRNPETDWTRYSTYLRSRPDEAELEAISLLISLARKYGCRVHIVHLSSARALPLLRAAREEGLPITVETCPHYLYASAETIPDGATQFKCAPPIRSKQNQRELWMALVNGDIDLIATDHSPCPPEMKSFESGSFLKAWGGIPSLSLALPIVWTRARERGIPLTDVVRWMSSKPAELAGLGARKGRIEKGYDADLVVFDADALYPVTTDMLYYKHPISPYMGEILEGKVKTTFVGGQKGFDNGVFSGSPAGRECSRS
jgi:allantoinase